MTRNEKIGLLENYSTFLAANGYMDEDWRSEPPYAIDEFLKLTEPESVSSCGDGWISVKDRLPEEGTDVLTFTPEWDGIGVLKYSRQYGTNILGFMYEDLAHIYGDTAYDATKWVTHWQPLPKAPTKTLRDMEKKELMAEELTIDKINGMTIDWTRWLDKLPNEMDQHEFNVVREHQIKAMSKHYSVPIEKVRIMFSPLF